MHIKILSKVKLWWINNFYTEEQIEYKHLAIIELLDPSLFNDYTLTDACMFKLSTLYETLEEYVAKISYVNSHINGKRTLRNNWCNYQYSETNIDRFLVKDNNQRNIVRNFKLEYTEYCNHLIIYKKFLNDKKFSIDENDHNFRILSEYTTHLNLLTLKLLEFIHV